MFDIKAIVVIVDRGSGDKVVNVAKKAGAAGATVFYARGTGELEAEKLFNLRTESSKEVVLILEEEEKVEAIQNAIIEDQKLKEPGTGIIFTVPVSGLVGLKHRKGDEELRV